MTGPQHFRQDDEHLAQRLRDVDPARGVAPLTEHRIEEIVMNTTTTRDSSEQTERTTPTRQQARRRAIVAGLAAAAAAAAIVTAVVVAQPRAGDTLALALPDPGVSTACAPLSAEFIADTHFAIEGRVTGIDGTAVTMEVLHQYTGESTDTVTVPQGGDDLISVPTQRFEVGGTYLVSAVDGVVTSCGMTGPSSPELKSLYEEAFS
jgi:hypothetical protein